MFLFFKAKSNGDIVTAVGGGGGDLIAKVDLAKGYESFVVEITTANSDGVLRNGDSITLRANGGQYWSAKNGGGSDVDAVASQALGWETFKIKCKDGTAAGAAIASKMVVALQTKNGQWVSAPVDGSGNGLPLVALVGTPESATAAHFEVFIGGGNVDRPSYGKWDSWNPPAL